MSLQHANVPKQEEDRMRTAKYGVALLLAAVLMSGSALSIASAAGPESQAISGIVTGNVQKVGFRALISSGASSSTSQDRRGTPRRERYNLSCKATRIGSVRLSW